MMAAAPVNETIRGRQGNEIEKHISQNTDPTHQNSTESVDRYLAKV